MTPTPTQDLIQALRTGPAVTMATIAASDRLEQLEHDLADMRRRAIKAESAASQAVAEINLLHTGMDSLTRERDWLTDCMATLVRENADLAVVDAACGRAHMALSEVGKEPQA